MASGKFQGEMQANGPRPRSSEQVGLARGAPERDGPGEQPPRLRRVVAQEVDRLAHVAQRVLHRLAGLAHHDGHEAHAVALVEVGGAVEDPCALRAAEPVPGVPGRVRAGDRRLDRRRIRRAHRADAMLPVVRAQHQLDAVRARSMSGRRRWGRPRRSAPARPRSPAAAAARARTARSAPNRQLLTRSGA